MSFHVINHRSASLVNLLTYLDTKCVLLGSRQWFGDMDFSDKDQILMENFF